MITIMWSQLTNKWPLMVMLCLIVDPSMFDWAFDGRAKLPLWQYLWAFDGRASGP